MDKDPKTLAEDGKCAFLQPLDVQVMWYPPHQTRGMNGTPLPLIFLGIRLFELT